MKAWMLGRKKETAADVAVPEKDDCVACLYVREHVNLIDGVTFVELETGELRRVEVHVGADGLVAMLCDRTTLLAATHELESERDSLN